jgi:hypothetical protein
MLKSEVKEILECTLTDYIDDDSEIQEAVRLILKDMKPLRGMVDDDDEDEDEDAVNDLDD